MLVTWDQTSIEANSKHRFSVCGDGWRGAPRLGPGSAPTLGTGCLDLLSSPGVWKPALWVCSELPEVRVSTCLSLLLSCCPAASRASLCLPQEVRDKIRYDFPQREGQSSLAPPLGPLGLWHVGTAACGIGGCARGPSLALQRPRPPAQGLPGRTLPAPWATGAARRPDSRESLSCLVNT